MSSRSTIPQDLPYPDEFNVGNLKLSANQIDVGTSTNKPNLRYNAATSKWQYSNDGITWTDIGSGGGGSGDVVGPASSVDNTIPRFDSTTGKLLQTSGIVIDNFDAMTFNNAAAPSILSVAATATVPTLIPNKADLDTGIGWAAANALSLIAGGAEASRMTQTPTGAGQTVASLIHTKTAVLGKDTTNEAAFSLNYTTNKLTSGNDTGLLINQTDTASPGTSLLIDAQVGGTSKFNVDNGGTLRSGGSILAGLSGNGTFFGYNLSSGQGTAITLNLYGGGGVCTNSYNITPLSAITATTGSVAVLKITPTYNQASGSAANTDLVINRTETAVGSGTQLLMDLQVATRGSYFAISNYGSMIVPTTIVTPGTTGNQTINKLAGRVNIAAAGTTITVTNSLVTANSIIVAVAATNDTTASVRNVVAAAGSFVINVVGVTAETAFNWIVIS
jgi:hypothetical protein